MLIRGVERTEEMTVFLSSLPHAQHQQQQPLHILDVKPKLIQPLLCQFDVHYISHEGKDSYHFKVSICLQYCSKRKI